MVRSRRGDAEQTDNAGGLLGVRVVGGDLQRSGPYGDQADLVGDRIVHLAGRLSAFAGEHGLRAHGVKR
ncbi:hypothetical protein [Streptomyces lacrimifluminis]|nr:hypothetical protein [Streptomyces lacrimifluminis]